MCIKLSIFFFTIRCCYGGRFWLLLDKNILSNFFVKKKNEVEKWKIAHKNLMNGDFGGFEQRNKKQKRSDRTQEEEEDRIWIWLFIYMKKIQHFGFTKKIEVNFGLRNWFLKGGLPWVWQGRDQKFLKGKNEKNKGYPFFVFSSKFYRWPKKGSALTFLTFWFFFWERHPCALGYGPVY